MELILGYVVKELLEVPTKVPSAWALTLDSAKVADLSRSNVTEGFRKSVQGRS